MSNNASKYVKVSANGVQIANLLSVHSTFEREFTVENGVLTVPNNVMKVTLRREKLLGDSRSDGLNLRTLSKFSLVITYPGVTSSYSNCEWINFSETISEDGTVTEEMTVASLSYTITT